MHIILVRGKIVGGERKTTKDSESICADWVSLQELVDGTKDGKQQPGFRSFRKPHELASIVNTYQHAQDHNIGIEIV